MDDLRHRLERAWNDRGQLTRLHNDLAKVRVLDPACGCGNFLIVAYRELRALELDLLLRQRELDFLDKGRDYAQLSFDVTGDLKVTLDHFYGIEIEEWPARIAETAMLLVDHLANQRMAEDFGLAPDRLPIRIAPKIHLGSALTVDWNAVVPAEELSFIVGNPPFYGSRKMNAVQKAELRAVAHGIREAGFLDFVAAWYLLAARMMALNPKIRAALVSTNSIAQGEQPAILWRPLYRAGIHIDFAHQTFDWQNEAPDQAAVDCIIVGFSAQDVRPKRLFSYASSSSEPTESEADTISPYLLSGSEYVVGNRQSQISGRKEMVFGNMAADDGNLILSVEQRDRLVDEYPETAEWLLPFYGSREYINGKLRYCLWLENVDPTRWQQVPEIVARVEANFATRSDSARPQLARTPHLFAQITQRPSSSFLLVPRTSSERRAYVPMGFFEAGVIASDGCLVVPDASVIDFALMTSEMHMDWMRTIGGRLESRYRYSKDVVYNNFVFPTVGDEQAVVLADLGGSVLQARASHADRTLAWMYDAATMPGALRQAHLELDRYVESLYRPQGFSGQSERVAYLLGLNQRMEAGLLLDAMSGSRKVREPR
nr:DNA methyltransferase [Leifsonia soli]